jgi:NAD(P)-dependent dehydrogenase (short-subunit alcohol dehydrogenase family)
MSGERLPGFRPRTALITGGTAGIGLETALAFARRGTTCILTGAPGEEHAARRGFAESGAPDPEIHFAVAGRGEETSRIVCDLRRRYDSVDVLVSSAAAHAIGGVEDYCANALFAAIGSSAWPLIDYTLRIREVFGRCPRYVIGVSSTGVDSWTCGYDLAAASNAVMETLCRYLSFRLKNEDVRLNVVRCGRPDTVSGFEEFAARLARDKYRLDHREVANAIVAMCSGLMDAFNGQVLTVDRGMSFFDCAMRLYAESTQAAC